MELLLYTMLTMSFAAIGLMSLGTYVIIGSIREMVED